MNGWENPLALLTDALGEFLTRIGCALLAAVFTALAVGAWLPDATPLSFAELLLTRNGIGQLFYGLVFTFLAIATLSLAPLLGADRGTIIGIYLAYWMTAALLSLPVILIIAAFGGEHTVMYVAGLLTTVVMAVTFTAVMVAYRLEHNLQAAYERIKAGAKGHCPGCEAKLQDAVAHAAAHCPACGEAIPESAYRSAFREWRQQRLSQVGVTQQG